MGIKTQLVEKRNELEAKQKKLAEIFQQAGDDMDFDQVTALKGDTSEKLGEVRKLNTELEALGEEADALAEIERMEKNARRQFEGMKSFETKEAFDHPRGGEKKIMSFGEQFVKSGIYGADGKVIKNKTVMLDVELKTLMSTSAGWDPEDLRTGRVVEYATRPVQIIDIVPMGQTSMSTVVYMQESTFTNNAAEVSEGGDYGEGALALTEQTSAVRKIAVFLPITDEQLEDVPQVQGYVNNRLRFMLRQRMDSQIVNGNGSAPNLTGILNESNLQTFAKTGDQFDALYTAAKKVRVTGRAVPNVFLFHPNDWQQVRTARTNDGLYILGNPDQSGPGRVWGLAVVESDAMPEDTVLCGDFPNFVELTERRGIEVSVSDSHSDYFIKGKQAIRADVRVALPIYRPAAFCEVTSF